MMQAKKSEVPAKYGTDIKKRVEILLREEIQLDQQAENKKNKKFYGKNWETTITYDNIHHHRFRVPVEVYSIEQYRNRLNNARTLEDVEKILKDYNKHQQKERKLEKPKKKKHWWQRAKQEERNL